MFIKNEGRVVFLFGVTHSFIVIHHHSRPTDRQNISNGFLCSKWRWDSGKLVIALSQEVYSHFHFGATSFCNFTCLRPVSFEVFLVGLSGISSPWKWITSGPATCPGNADGERSLSTISSSDTAPLPEGGIMTILSGQQWPPLVTTRKDYLLTQHSRDLELPSSLLFVLCFENSITVG